MDRENKKRDQRRGKVEGKQNLNRNNTSERMKVSRTGEGVTAGAPCTGIHAVLTQ